MLSDVKLRVYSDGTCDTSWTKPRQLWVIQQALRGSQATNPSCRTPPSCCTVCTTLVTQKHLLLQGQTSMFHDPLPPMGNQCEWKLHSVTYKLMSCRCSFIPHPSRVGASKAVNMINFVSVVQVLKRCQAWTNMGNVWWAFVYSVEEDFELIKMGVAVKLSFDSCSKPAKPTWSIQRHP